MTDEELKALEEKAKAATPGPWAWWTSCSYRRLSSEATGKDGDVLRGVACKDGVVDIQGSVADKCFIEIANPAAVLSLIARLRKAEDRVRSFEQAQRALRADDDRCGW